MKKALLIAIILALLLPQTVMAQVQLHLNFIDPTLPVQPTIQNAVRQTLLHEAASLDRKLYYTITDVVELPQEDGSKKYSVSVAGVTQPINWYYGEHTRWIGTVWLYDAYGGQMWGSLCDPVTLQCKEIDLSSGGWADVNVGMEAAQALNDTRTMNYYEASGAMGIEAVNSRTDPTLPLLWPMPHSLYAIYGVNGVHSAGFPGWATAGWVAIDLVGSMDFDTYPAPLALWRLGQLIAPQDIMVMGVCNDSYSRAIYVYANMKQNQGSPNMQDNMLFAHLDVSNPPYPTGQVFFRGEHIGTLRYGSFNSNCGFASQQDTTFHVHWGFPNIGSFLIENCLLDTSTGVFTCSDESTYEPLDFLPPAGGGVDGPPLPTRKIGSNFWDWVVDGLTSIYTNLLNSIFPDARSANIGIILADSAVLAIEVAYVLAGSFINLTWPITVVVIVLAMQIFMVPYIALRVVKKIVPGLP